MIMLNPSVATARLEPCSLTIGTSNRLLSAAATPASKNASRKGTPKCSVALRKHRRRCRRTRLARATAARHADEKLKPKREDRADERDAEDVQPVAIGLRQKGTATKAPRTSTLIAARFHGTMLRSCARRVSKIPDGASSRIAINSDHADRVFVGRRNQDAGKSFDQAESEPAQHRAGQTAKPPSVAATNALMPKRKPILNDAKNSEPSNTPAAPAITPATRKV